QRSRIRELVPEPLQEREKLLAQLFERRRGEIEMIRRGRGQRGDQLRAGRIEHSGAGLRSPDVEDQPHPAAPWNGANLGIESGRRNERPPLWIVLHLTGKRRHWRSGAHDITLPQPVSFTWRS